LAFYETEDASFIQLSLSQHLAGARGGAGPREREFRPERSTDALNSYGKVAQSGSLPFRPGSELTIDSHFGAGIRFRRWCGCTRRWCWAQCTLVSMKCGRREGVWYNVVGVKDNPRKRLDMSCRVFYHSAGTCSKTDCRGVGLTYCPALRQASP